MIFVPKLVAKLSCCLLIISLCLFSLISKASQTKSQDIYVKQGYLTGADNNQLFYREIGNPNKPQQATIIFLHGGPGFDMNDGGYEMDELGKHFRVIFFDQRGGGKSQAIQDLTKLTPQRMVEDIRAIKAHYQLDNFTLVGHSWGTGLAMLYAKAYPDDVNKMILLAPMPIRQTMISHRFLQVRKLLSEQDNKRLAELRGADLSQASVQEVIANCQEYIPLIFKPYFSHISNWRNMKGDFCGSDPEGIKRRWFIYNHVIAQINGYDWRDAAREYYGPVYLVDGEWSMVPLNTTTEWAGYFPNSRVEMVKNAGHVLWLDAPQHLHNNMVQFMYGQWPKEAYKLDPVDLDLLAHYRFDSNIQNSADNHFHLEAQTPLNFSDDRFGDQAKALASNQQTLIVKEPNWAIDNNHWSWTFWFKANQSRQTVLTQGQDAISLQIRQGKLQLKVGSLVLEDKTTLAQDKWTHISIVRTNDKVALYRDSKMVASGSKYSLPDQSGDFTLNAQAGDFDELRVYATSLTDTLIKQIYHQLNQQ